MILHLCHDEKFTDQIIRLFETAYPEDNIYLIKKKSIEYPNVYVYSNNSSIVYTDNDHYLEDISNFAFEGVVIHFMDDFYAKYVNISKDSNAAWVFWGADGYFLPRLSNDLYGPFTMEYIKNNQKTGIVKQWYRKLLFEFQAIFGPRLTYRERIRAIKKIKYIVSAVEEDFDHISSKYDTNASFVDFFYLDSSRLIDETLLNQEICGSNIYIGNSCSTECNHLDALELIYKQHLESEIICTLNYGKDFNSNYPNKIKEFGCKLFGQKFHLIEEYLEVKAFNVLLLRCSIAIFYHHRQQAFNTIITCIYLGHQVFLSRNNTIFHFLKRIGCRVYDFERRFKPEIINQFSKADAENNKKIIEDYFSSDHMKNKAKNLVNLLKK